MTQSLDRVRKAARLRKKEQLTALFHHINVDTLRTYYALKRKAVPGVDGMTWVDYEADLELRLEPGQGYTTTDLRATFVKSVRENSGPISCEATLLHLGGRTASSEGRVYDQKGTHSGVLHGRLVLINNRGS